MMLQIKMSAATSRASHYAIKLSCIEVALEVAFDRLESWLITRDKPEVGYMWEYTSATGWEVQF